MYLVQLNSRAKIIAPFREVLFVAGPALWLQIDRQPPGDLWPVPVRLDLLHVRVFFLAKTSASICRRRAISRNSAAWWRYSFAADAKSCWLGVLRVEFSGGAVEQPVIAERTTSMPAMRSVGDNIVPPFKEDSAWSRRHVAGARIPIDMRTPVSMIRLTQPFEDR